MAVIAYFATLRVLSADETKARALVAQHNNIAYMCNFSLAKEWFERTNKQSLVI